MENLLNTIARGFFKTLGGRRMRVCAACGHQGHQVRDARGEQTCASCGSHLLVSPDSPIGRGRRFRHSKI